MRAWKDRPLLLRGRLHGRSLTILGIVAAVAVLLAAWQFALALFGGDERERTEWTGIDETVGAAATDADDTGHADDTEESAAAATQDEAGHSDDAEATASESPSAPPDSGPESTERDRPETPAESREEAGTAPAACTAALTIDSVWSNAVAVSVDVVNTGDTSIDGWTIDLDLDGARVTGAWGMEHQRGHTWSNTFYNGDLDPGQRAGSTFHAQTGDGADLPESVPCATTGR